MNNLTWLKWAVLGVNVFGIVLAGCGSDAEESNEPEGVRSSAFKAGVRLTAVLAQASDGTATFLHWRDNQLGLHCRFQPVGSGYRCLPFGSSPGLVFGIEGSFGDAQCTQPLLRASAEALVGQPSLVRLLSSPHGWDPSSYFNVGVPYAEPVVYRKSMTGCAPEPLKEGETLQTLVPLAIEGFAGGQFKAEAAVDGVAPLYIVGEDGAREPRGFRDAAGVDCWPHKTTEGIRCLPIDFGWASRGDAFADSRCVSPLAAGALGAGDRRTSLPFVFIDDVAKGFETVTSVHRGAAVLSAVYSSLGEGGCEMVKGTSRWFAAGEAVPLASFAPSSFSQITRSSGLVQDVAEVKGIKMGTFELPTSSSLGGYECQLATTPDGAVRCVPPIGGDVPDYADAACTDVIWGTGRLVMSVTSDLGTSVPGPPAKASDVVLPKVVRILSGGVKYQGPVYQRRGTDCTLYPDVPNSRQPYARFASEVPFKNFVPMPIVER